MNVNVRQPTANDLLRLREPSWQRYGRRRPSLFVLTDYLDRTRDGYEATLRRGFERRCSDLGIRLVIVVGHALTAGDTSTDPYARIFDHVGFDAADGVILVSSGLAAKAGTDALTQLVLRLGGLPVCSLGQPMPGYPSVLCDNRAGMQAMVEHIARVHQRKHLVYIDGITTNQEASLRRQVCCEVLGRNGLNLAPSAIASGQFTSAGGAHAVKALLRRNSQVDAVIAANDSMALGAMEVLRQEGLHPGPCLSVTGFDDMQAGRLAEPALTTVRQPSIKMAELAVDIVAAQWLGWPVAAETVLSSELVIRTSCGCRGAWASARHEPSSLETLSLETSAAQFFDSRQDAICGQLDAILRQELLEIPFQSREMIAAFRDELTGSPGALERHVQYCITRLLRHHTSIEVLLPLLAFVRGSLPPKLALDLEATWPFLLSNIAAASARVQLEQRLEVESMYFSLIDASQRIIAALDFDSLVQALAATIPQLVQGRVFVGLLTAPDGDTLETLLSSDSPDQPLAMRTLSMRRLMPDAIGNSDENRTILVLPLVNDSELVGSIAIEALDRTFDYQLLRDHIGTSLRVITLHSEVLNQVTLRERSVQERLATAERVRTLSVLSGGVAHDLNNALGSLVALTDVVIGELDGVCRDHREVNLDDARQDLLTIKSGAKRAAETVKDLMTLGRRGNVPPRPTEVARLLRATVDDLGLQLNADQVMRLQFDVAEGTRRECLIANEVKLVRAIGNLVRNAMDATTEDGRVLVRAERRVLRQAQSGHELVPPGDYIAISVSDNGCGIPENQLSHIFEPFFSTKYGSVKSGSGLGLTIVQGTVKEHGGYLDVTSRPGMGTTFVIYLPRSELSAEQRVSEPAGTRRKARILVVDDDPTQLRTARRVLQTAGYEVVTHSSGEAALELVKSRLSATEAGRPASIPTSPFDVIMLDMALNERFTGLEILQQIRKMLPHQPAIIASGHGQLLEEMHTEMEDLVWLPKPYTRNALSNAISQLISR